MIYLLAKLFDKLLVRVKVVNARKLRQAVFDVVKIPLDINVARLRVKEIHDTVSVFGYKDVSAAVICPNNENFTACSVTPTYHVLDNLGLARTLRTVQPHGIFKDVVPIVRELVGR